MPTVAPLVGRARERAALADLVDAAAKGSGRIVLIEGEAGIGKTRLVEEGVERATTLGMKALRGDAHALESRRPFGVLADCLGIDPDAPDAPRRQIAMLLQGDPTRAGPAAVAGTAEAEFRIGEAILAFVSDLSTRQPLALVIEDLQWADPASLVVLHRLGRSVAQSPVLLICSFRTLPRSPQLQELLDSLLDRGASLLRLGPLDDRDVIALAEVLLGAVPGTGLRRQLEGAGGNPLFVTELIAALRGSDAVSFVDGRVDSTASVVPRSLQVTILQRLRFLSEETLEVLRTASLLGSSFTVADLSLVLGRPAFALLPALRQALEAGILGEEGSRLVFRHDLIQEALYQDLPLPVRIGLHLEVGRALAAAGAPAGQVAEHFLRGAAPGDAEAVEWLRKAAADVAPRAPAVAADLLERALELAGPTAALRDCLLTDLAIDLAAAGRTAESVRICREVLARDHDPSVEGRARMCLTQSLLANGQAAESLHAAEDAARSVMLSDVEQARFRAWTAVGMLSVGDFAGAAAAAVEARDRGDALGDELTACIGRASLAGIAGLQGRFSEAVDVAGEAIRMAEASRSREALWFPIHMFRGAFLLDLDRLDEARAMIQLGRQVSEEMGARGTFVAHHCVSVLANYLAGRWDDALADFETSLELADEVSVRHTILFAWCLRALIALHRDDLVTAQAAVDAADREFAETGPQYRMDWLLWARGLLREATGDVAGAMAAVSAAWGLCSATGMAGEFPVLGPDLIRLSLTTGDRALAEQACLAVEAVAHKNEGVATLAGAARRSRGLLDDDAVALLEAVTAYRGGPRPFERALACEDAAVALARRDRRDEARALLDEALQLFDGLQANRDLARAEARLRALGLRRGTRGRRGRPTTGWASLTDTERKVVALVTEGRSNPEIAERMFVSRHTVQAHVSHILTKLGLTSRVELAALASRHLTASRSHA